MGSGWCAQEQQGQSPPIPFGSQALTRVCHENLSGGDGWLGGGRELHEHIGLRGVWGPSRVVQNCWWFPTPRPPPLWGREVGVGLNSAATPPYSHTHPPKLAPASPPPGPRKEAVWAWLRDWAIGGQRCPSPRPSLARARAALCPACLFRKIRWGQGWGGGDSDSDSGSRIQRNSPNAGRDTPERHMLAK